MLWRHGKVIWGAKPNSKRRKQVRVSFSKKIQSLNHHQNKTRENTAYKSFKKINGEKEDGKGQEMNRFLSLTFFLYKTKDGITILLSYSLDRISFPCMKHKEPKEGDAENTLLLALHHRLYLLYATP